MEEIELCLICKGSGREIFRCIDHKTGKVIEKVVRCSCCDGRGYKVVGISRRCFDLNSLGHYDIFDLKEDDY